MRSRAWRRVVATVATVATLAMVVLIVWATVALESHAQLRASISAVAGAAAAVFTALAAVAAWLAARSSQEAAEGAREAALVATKALSGTRPPGLSLDVWWWRSESGITLSADIEGDHWRRFEDIVVEWRVRFTESGEWTMFGSASIENVNPGEHRNPVELGGIELPAESMDFSAFYFQYQMFAKDSLYQTNWESHMTLPARATREDFDGRMNMRLYTIPAYPWSPHDESSLIRRWT